MTVGLEVTINKPLSLAGAVYFFDYIKYYVQN
jgi:hypothetical protein